MSLVWTMLAILRWTKTSPGSRPSTSFAVMRLSEQPIHRYLGACCSDSRRKKLGSCSVLRFAQAMFRSKR